MNGSNYVRVMYTKPSVPFSSIFIFKDSNFLRVCSFVVFNSHTANFRSRDITLRIILLVCVDIVSSQCTHKSTDCPSDLSLVHA